MAIHVPLLIIGLLLMVIGAIWYLYKNRRNGKTSFSSMVFLIGMAIAFLGYAGDGAACAILIGVFLAALM